MRFRKLTALAGLYIFCGPTRTPEVDAAAEARASGDPMKLLATYCIRCHGPEEQEADLRFDNLDALDPVRLQELFGTMKKALQLEEMPPEEARQPSDAERGVLLRWLDSRTSPEEKKKLADKLRKPEYGNYVDHEDLFSGAHANRPAFTYDRRWLISEFIFDAKMQRILQNRTVANWKGRRVPVHGGHKIRDLSLANPFLLPETSGVRYYAIEDLTGGHLSTMLSNAQKTARFITEKLIKDRRKKKFLPVTRQVLALEDQHEATLVSRRAFLSKNIARACRTTFGDQHEALLPKFVPTVLKAKKQFSAEDTKKDKPLPVPVARKLLEKAGGWDTYVQVVLDPANKGRTDREIADLCERIWFYFGDFERDIQSRLALLRDYSEGFRKLAAKDKRARRRKSKPPDAAELRIIQAALRQHRRPGDRYGQILERCLADWQQQFEQERIDAGPPSDALYAEVIDELFVHILERSPATDEADDYLSLVKGYTKKLGRRKAVQKLIQTLLLNSEFAYRNEFGTGKADAHGRRMMSPRAASYAIAYALTDQSPDAELVRAAKTGGLATREDFEREVTRILKRRDVFYQIDKNLADRAHRLSNTTDTAIRKLRFFREFFGYPKVLKIFKDEKRFGADRLHHATNRLLSEADRLVMHILHEDKDVFERLLTTEEFFVYHDGDNERMQTRSDWIKRIYRHFKDVDWQNYTEKDLLAHRDFLKEVGMRGIDPDKPGRRIRTGSMIQLFKMSMRSITDRLDNGQQEAAPFDLYLGYGNDFMPGFNVARFWNYDLGNWDYATVQPAKIPNRKGMLTHPAWLIAHAFNTETDPVHRGKWVREKLLAGTIPEVPITVDAQIPEDQDKTLRQRLAMATENEACWRCHVDMNPLGYAFEAYDDFGRFRTRESLEYPDKLVKKVPDRTHRINNHLLDRRHIYETLPVDAKGYLKGTGDRSLDGKLDGAVDLAERLGKSRRVRQSILRHAFRYFMGRNETLSDSKTLIDAERAYVTSSGSFDAVIVSLLTSDSFIYRKAIED